MFAGCRLSYIEARAEKKHDVGKQSGAVRVIVCVLCV